MSESEVVYPHIIYVPDATNQQVFVPQTVTPPPDPEPEPSGEPLAVVVIDGLTFSFNPMDGTALDAYYDPQGDFAQECIVCIHPDLSGFRAIYRPDITSNREEWIFEYGDPWETPPSESLSAYTVTITKRDESVIRIEVSAGHYWFSRWRWQSSVRPVRKTHAQLAAQNLIPFMDTTGLATGVILTVSDYTPMAYCGIPSDQGQTGGYPGLGIQTGWQSQYLVRAAPEASFRNQAEASGSFQAHIRDTNTWAPIDIVDDYPNATTYSEKEGNPFIPISPRVNKTDQGHMPSLTYIPYLLTGDPYYLEENQFWANQNMVSLPSSSRFMFSGRYIAWPLREIFECYLATPETIPSWLLPKSYWKHWMDYVKYCIADRMNNYSDPYYYIFHTIPDTGQANTADPAKSGDHVWQQNMLQLVVCWVASTQNDWIESAEWLIQNGIARASATSGWCRSRPSPYHIRLQNASALAEAITVDSTTIKLQYVQRFKNNMTIKIDSETMMLDNSTDGLTWSLKPRSAPKAHSVNAWVYGDKCLSWCEAKDLNILTYGWTGTDDNDHFSPETTDLTYMTYQRCALAQALHAGLQVPGLQEAYDYMDSEIRRFVTEKHLGVGDNWTVMPNVATTQRKRKHRSDLTDPQVNEFIAALIEEFRGDE